jgi:hypothetical protein
MQITLMSWPALVLWLVATGLVSFGGAWFGAYFKKKGENYATHEDLGNLVKQMEAVTTATKQIEAKISDEVWNRQRRWELKRDLILEGARRLGACMQAFMALLTACIEEIRENRAGRPATGAGRLDASRVWQAALEEFKASTYLIISLVCGKEFEGLMTKFGDITGKIGVGLSRGGPDALVREAEELRTVLNGLATGLRKELDAGV